MAQGRSGDVWGRGLVVGDAGWTGPLTHALDTLAERWETAATADLLDGIDVVVCVTALSAGGLVATEHVRDQVLAANPRPKRVVFVVTDSWLGVTGSPAMAAQSAATVAGGRALAIRLAAHGTMVNTVAVPAGFPDGGTSATAPVQTEVGVEDLAHTLRFLFSPDNGYITGQVLSLSGGDTVWTNLSA